MACLFEPDTDCCATCGASLEKYMRAGSRCPRRGDNVVHADRALARRHLDRQAKLLAAIRVEARRLQAAGRPVEPPAVWDLYETVAT